MQRWIQDSSLGRRQHFMGYQPTILPRLPIKIETDKNLSVGVNSVSANGMEFIRVCKQFDSIKFFTT